MLKESENDAVVRAYSDNFLDPFDYDESPQDKTTREEEERRRPNWMRLKRISGQVAVWGVGCTQS